MSMPSVRAASEITGAPRAGEMIVRSSTRAVSAVRTMPTATAAQKPSPHLPSSTPYQIQKAPRKIKDPWANERTPLDLKMTTKPRATSP
jgi:hypothetical protein